MKKSNVFVAVLCSAVISSLSFISGYTAAGENVTYNSSGVIKYDNNTATTSDDKVIFDAADFRTIDNAVTTGKKSVVSSLNAHVDAGLPTTSIPTFSELASAVNAVTNQGAQTKLLDTGTVQYIIPKGYHNGSGKVYINTETKTVTPNNAGFTTTPSSGKVLSSVKVNGDSDLVAGNVKTGVEIFGTIGTFTADATAAANQMLSGATAYVRGNKVTGNIPSKGAATYTPGTSNQTINAGQYLSGAQTIKGDGNLVAGNIVSGKSIFGVNGSAVVEKNSSAHSVPSGKTAAAAGDILTGKTAWNGSSWINGSMANKAGLTVAASTASESGTNALITIPQAGYYSTGSKVSIPIDTLKGLSSLNSSIKYIQNSTDCSYPVGYMQSNGTKLSATWNYTFTSSNTYTVVEFIHADRIKSSLVLTHVNGSQEILCNYDVLDDQDIPKSQVVKTFYAEQGSTLQLFVDEITEKSTNVAIVFTMLIW